MGIEKFADMDNLYHGCGRISSAVERLFIPTGTLPDLSLSADLVTPGAVYLDVYAVDIDHEGKVDLPAILLQCGYDDARISGIGPKAGYEQLVLHNSGLLTFDSTLWGDNATIGDVGIATTPAQANAFRKYVIDKSLE